MSRILTGIQSSGKPHLGNILGAILPAIQLSEQARNESFLFIADLHSLTSVKDGNVLKDNTRAVAAAWLACGLDTEKVVFYRQSRVAAYHTELTWYLSCLTPFPMLANAHSFKDKADRLSDVNAGLFIYPVLMASDILLYDANYVPVGKDQKQHLEMTRDMARAVNHHFNSELFVIPESQISETMMVIPGTDGRKMSKSYGNVIDVFLPEKLLLRQVKEIVTDSSPLEEPKNPDTCNVFALYQLLGSALQVADLRAKYLAGGFGYGHAKQALFECILENFREERLRFDTLMAHPDEIERQLQLGAAKARPTAHAVLNRLRAVLGYGA